MCSPKDIKRYGVLNAEFSSRQNASLSLDLFNALYRIVNQSSIYTIDFNNFQNIFEK